MKVSILQFKPIFKDIDENFKTVIRLMEKAMSDKPDVIVLPELWSTGFYPQPVQNFSDHNGQKTCDFLATLAKNYNINIVGGTVIVDIDGKFYNRCFIFNRYGKNIAVYDKIHLFSMSKEDEIFSFGKTVPIFDLDDIRVSVAVCYDLRFPELIRDITLNNISVLFLPAAWPLKRLAHWKILLRARAIENQIFVVAANSAGYSAVIDPWGETISEAEKGENIITVNINLNIREEIQGIMNVLGDLRNYELKIYQKNS